MNQHDRIKNYYDRFAEIYDTKHGVILAGQSYNFKNYYEPFLKKVLPQSGTILELGCGTGVYTKWLMERRLQVIGMDISSEMIKQAKRRCPNALFYQGDCENPGAYISTKELQNGFDAVVGINTFSYYVHKETALLNYRKLLKPNGHFIVIDMNGTCPYYQWMSWLNKNEMREWLAQIKESNRKTIALLFQKTDFQLKTLEHFSFIPNGVGPSTVLLLQPVDKILSSIPAARKFSMRMAYSASL